VQLALRGGAHAGVSILAMFQGPSYGHSLTEGTFCLGWRVEGIRYRDNNMIVSQNFQTLTLGLLGLKKIWKPFDDLS
jgi:hypothetical protein